jgi:hypothetical protein
VSVPEQARRSERQRDPFSTGTVTIARAGQAARTLGTTGWTAIGILPERAACPIGGRICPAIVR